ncbi:MAG: hypothetical protein ACMUIU_00400 [bacterium]
MINTDFSLSLLDFFTYLFPGALIIMCFLLNDFSLITKWQMSEIDKYIMIFILSYLIGHLLTLVSSLIPKGFDCFRGKQKQGLFNETVISNKPKRGHKNHKRFSDEIKSLKEGIKVYFQDVLDYTGEDRQILELSRQLVLDHSPSGKEYINRLYTMSLFARNMVVACLVLSIFFSYQKQYHNSIFVIISLTTSILFLLRYRRLSISMENAIYRAAFLFLKLK